MNIDNFTLGELKQIAAIVNNQIGTLMQAFVGDDFDQYREDALMEDSRCNGFLDEVLFKHGPNMGRLAKVHEYLDETRPAREELTA